MRADVVIVGLGTAGAAVAAACARHGLSVIGIEGRPADRAGAHWVNGVPLHAFRTAGLPLPPAALRGASVPFHLKAGFDGPRMCVREHDLLEVDMRALTDALAADATSHGAALHYDTSASRIDARGVQTPIGHIDADMLVVRATGLKDHPSPPARSDLCAAAQQTRPVHDLVEARRFFRSHGVQPGDTLCFTGIAGGYSIINVRLDGSHLEILTGSLPGRGHPAGLQLASTFATEHPWVGEPIAGGSRAIPLGPPVARLDIDGIFHVGDAAGMVHSAHGSGIAQQLHAAGLIADGLARGHDAWRLNQRWQRRYAGLLTSADVFRRFSTTLTAEELGALIERNVLTEGLFGSGLVQRSPRPGARDLAQATRGLVKLPRLAARLGPVLARMQAVEAWGSRYPRDPGRVDAWDRRRRQLAG